MMQKKPQFNTEGLKLCLLFAAYLITLFLLLNLSRTSSVISLIYTALVLCTPIVFYKITKYQVTISGATSFMRIFMNAINIYIFGALMLAGVQYLYYEYIAPGEIQRLMEQSINDTQRLFPHFADQFKDIDVTSLINGAVFAMSVFQMNLIIGIILSLIISLFIIRKIKSNPL